MTQIPIDLPYSIFPQKILVIGAGAIGCLIGGQLTFMGHQVTLVGRRSLQEAIKWQGLRIVTDGISNLTWDVTVVTSTANAFAERRTYDWVFLTAKAFDVPSAMIELSVATSVIPPVITLQNGIGSEEAVAAILGPERLIAGTITTPVEVLGVGHLETVKKGGIGLATWQSASPNPTLLAQALRQAGFAVKIYNNAQAMKWSKLLLNMIGNATSAILGWPPQQTIADPRLYDIELDAVTEACQVMQAMGISKINLPSYPVRFQYLPLVRLPRPLTRPIMEYMVSKARAGKMPSLYLGLEAGRKRSEVEVLNGAIVATGEALGIRTPVNRVLMQLVTKLAKGELERAAFHHNPEALLAEVERAR